jgi:hypothetical protein
MSKGFANIVMLAIRDEWERATRDHGRLNSCHEGYAVLLEEVDELWEEVRKKRAERSKERMFAECKQIAAVAMRFMIELCATESVESAQSADEFSVPPCLRGENLK